MKFPNAYAGVKQLFTAQILNILSTVVFFAGAVYAMLVPGEISPDENETAFFVLLGITVGATVLALVAFIVQLIGLNTARKDERLFKKAMYFVIICAVCTVALMLAGGMFGKITAGVDEVSTLLIFVYIFLSIYIIAEKMGETGMQKGGKLALLIVTVAFGSALLMQIIAAFIPERVDTVETIDFVSAIVEFAGYITAMIYIGMAKKMLAKAA